LRFITSGFLAGAVLALVLTLPAEAHHSFTNFWQMDRTVMITGVVKSLKLVNPHPELVVEVTTESGAVETWTITGRATGTGILRAGWSIDTVPVGVTVTIDGNPSRREGARALAAGRIIFEDGNEVWFGGGGGIPAG
jgi:hypothetical protein